jgi:hypothetical protein
VPTAAFSGGEERNAAEKARRINTRNRAEEGATWLVDAGEDRGRSRRRKKKKKKKKKNHVDARKHRQLLSAVALRLRLRLLSENARFLPSFVALQASMAHFASWGLNPNSTCQSG